MLLRHGSNLSKDRSLYETQGGSDPLADLSSPGTLDAYGYGRSSPVTLKDPGGLFTCPDLACLTAGGGFLGGTPPSCLQACTGQELVDEIAADGDGLGAAVFAVIDAANQGDPEKADGNWSSKDISAAAGGKNIDAVVAALGLEGRDAMQFTALVRDVATRLQGQDALWEKIDKERNWWQRNGGTVLAIGGTLACFGGPLACGLGQAAQHLNKGVQQVQSGGWRSLGSRDFLTSTAIDVGLSRIGGRAVGSKQGWVHAAGGLRAQGRNFRAGLYEAGAVAGRTTRQVTAGTIDASIEASCGAAPSSTGALAAAC